jgi:hypothetical protein
MLVYDQGGGVGPTSEFADALLSERMTAVLPPGVNSEMFEVLPIFAAALLLGLLSGVVAVCLLTAGPTVPSRRAVIGGAVLAALLFSLIAAKPGSWLVTVGFWALAAGGMAAVDLAVLCLLVSWRVSPRPADRCVRRLAAWLPFWLPAAAATLLLVIRVFLVLGPTTMSSLTLAIIVIVIIVPLAFLDLTARLVAIWWDRRRSGD